MSDVCDGKSYKEHPLFCIISTVWKLCYNMMTLKYAILFPPEQKFINYLLI